MRILVLSTCYPTRSRPDLGVFIHRQIRALADLGADCRVLQPIDWAPPAPFHRLHPGWEVGRSRRLDVLAEVQGIPIYHPPVHHPKPSRFFPGDAWERTGHWVARAVARDHNLRKADILYAHFLCHEGYAGLIAKRRLGLPLAAIARGDDVHAWPERWPDRAPKLAAVLSEADALIACSGGLARDAKRWATKGLAHPIEVIYNGIEADRFSPAHCPEDRLRARQRFGIPLEENILLCVASAVATKGWLELLDAFAAAAPSEWSLVGVGAGGALDLQAMAAERGLCHRFHWLGMLPPEHMPDLYRAADAFALASHNEGLSNSLLEAMATGLPVITTQVGGHDEVLTGQEGWLVPPRDPRALAGALAEALSDAAQAAEKGRRARAHAKSFGSPRDHAARLLAHFEILLSNRLNTSKTSAL